MVKLHYIKLIKTNQSIKNILEFNDRVRPRSKADKKKKRDTHKSLHALHEGRELVLNVFKSGIFPSK